MGDSYTASSFDEHLANFNLIGLQIPPNLNFQEIPTPLLENEKNRRVQQDWGGCFMGNGIRLFWSLVDYTPDVIFVVILETGRLLDVNQSGGRLGYTINKLMTMCLWDVDED